MAVDPNLVDDIAARIAAIYAEAETALVRLTTRHITSGLARNRLGAVRDLRRGAQAVIAGLEADSSTAIREGLTDAYRHGWDSAVADIPKRWFQKSLIGQAARAALSIIPGFGFVEALATALIKDFGQVHNNMLRNVDDAYRAVQAAAAARVITGAQTRREASQAAWQALTDRGLNSFTDRAGRRWQLSSYVEMAARTNAQRVATTAQVDRLDTLGVDLVFVDEHLQECVRCRPFEGQVLRTDAGPTGRIQVEHGINDGQMVTVHVVATLDEARAAGLFHPNCRHSVSAYFPGITRLPEAVGDPEGNKARMRQRELERRIRKYKTREIGALGPEAKKAAHQQVLAAQAALREHLAANPALKRLRYREQIGAGNIPSPGTNDPAGSLTGLPAQLSL